MPFNALVVDDDHDHRRRLRAMLEALGAQVSDESERTLALRQLLHTPFDLVMLKIDMPEMEGRRTVSQIRSGGHANAHAPFIGVAQQVSTGELPSYIQAGFHAALPRPVQPWRLREILYELGLVDRPLSPAEDSLKVLGALSSKPRLELYAVIAGLGDATVTALTSSMGVRRQNLTFHLDALRDAGLVDIEKRGRETWYSVRQDRIQAAAHWMLDMADRPSDYGPSPAPQQPRRIERPAKR